MARDGTQLALPPRQSKASQDSHLEVELPPQVGMLLMLAGPSLDAGRGGNFSKE